MAKRYLTLEGLTTYDGLIKAYIGEADAKAIKCGKIEDGVLKLYKSENPAAGTEPDFALEIPVIPKKGYQADWDSLDNFIPLDGELITYLPDEIYPFPRVKFGDGVHLPRELPFAICDPDNIVAARVKHTLTFGNGEVYQYDGSEDVTVPVYTGNYSD